MADTQISIDGPTLSLLMFEALNSGADGEGILLGQRSRASVEHMSDVSAQDRKETTHVKVQSFAYFGKGRSTFDNCGKLDGAKFELMAGTLPQCSSGDAEVIGWVSYYNRCPCSKPKRPSLRTKYMHRQIYEHFFGKLSMIHLQICNKAPTDTEGILEQHYQVYYSPAGATPGPRFMVPMELKINNLVTTDHSGYKHEPSPLTPLLPSNKLYPPNPSVAFVKDMAAHLEKMMLKEVTEISDLEEQLRAKRVEEAKAELTTDEPITERQLCTIYPIGHARQARRDLATPSPPVPEVKDDKVDIPEFSDDESLSDKVEFQNAQNGLVENGDLANGNAPDLINLAGDEEPGYELTVTPHAPKPEPMDLTDSAYFAPELKKGFFPDTKKPEEDDEALAKKLQEEFDAEHAEDVQRRVDREQEDQRHTEKLRDEIRRDEQRRMTRTATGAIQGTHYDTDIFDAEKSPGHSDDLFGDKDFPPLAAYTIPRRPQPSFAPYEPRAEAKPPVRPPGLSRSNAPERHGTQIRAPAPRHELDRKDYADAMFPAENLFDRNRPKYDSAMPNVTTRRTANTSRPNATVPVGGSTRRLQNPQNKTMTGDQIVNMLATDDDLTESNENDPGGAGSLTSELRDREQQREAGTSVDDEGGFTSDDHTFLIEEDGGTHEAQNLFETNKESEKEVQGKGKRDCADNSSSNSEETAGDTGPGPGPGPSTGWIGKGAKEAPRGHGKPPRKKGKDDEGKPTSAGRGRGGTKR